MSIESLPLDVLLLVLGPLQLREYCALMCLSKKMCKILRQDAFWTIVVRRATGEQRTSSAYGRFLTVLPSISHRYYCPACGRSFSPAEAKVDTEALAAQVSSELPEEIEEGELGNRWRSDSCEGEAELPEMTVHHMHCCCSLSDPIPLTIEVVPIGTFYLYSDKDRWTRFRGLSYLQDCRVLPPYSPTLARWTVDQILRCPGPAP